MKNNVQSWFKLLKERLRRGKEGPLKPEIVISLETIKDPFIERLMDSNETLRNKVLEKAREVKKLSGVLQIFLKMLPQNESSRVVKLDVQNLTALLIINDQKPEQITINVYMPSLSEKNVGHLFATGNDETFRIDDIYIEPNFRENKLGSAIMTQAIGIFIKYRAKSANGTFIVEPEQAQKTEHFFRKFGFSVTYNSENKMTVEWIFKEGMTFFLPHFD